MKQNLITDIIQGMLPYLNNAQSKRHKRGRKTERKQEKKRVKKTFIWAPLYRGFFHGKKRVILVVSFMVKRSKMCYTRVRQFVGG